MQWQAERINEWKNGRENGKKAMWFIPDDEWVCKHRTNPMIIMATVPYNGIQYSYTASESLSTQTRCCCCCSCFYCYTIIIAKYMRKNKSIKLPLINSYTRNTTVACMRTHTIAHTGTSRKRTNSPANASDTHFLFWGKIKYYSICTLSSVCCHSHFLVWYIRYVCIYTHRSSMVETMVWCVVAHASANIECVCIGNW